MKNPNQKSPPNNSQRSLLHSTKIFLVLINWNNTTEKLPNTLRPWSSYSCIRTIASKIWKYLY